MARKLLGIAVFMLLLFSVVGLSACSGISLANYKSQVKAELDAYAAPSDYSEANWQAVLEIIAGGKAAIDAAKNKYNIDTAVTTAKTGIDKVSKEDSVKQGIYATTENKHSLEYASVYLHDDNKFAFDRGIIYSYLPTGNYSVRDGNLILHLGESVEYIFKIEKDQIVFLGAFLDGAHIPGTTTSYPVKIGTTFYLSDENSRT